MLFVMSTRSVCHSIPLLSILTMDESDPAQSLLGKKFALAKSG